MITLLHRFAVPFKTMYVNLFPEKTALESNKKIVEGNQEYKKLHRVE